MAPIAQQTTVSSIQDDNLRAPLANRERIHLRGLERFMTMSDSASFQIAHTMHVRGQIEELLLQLPMALMMTFNKHPKMRVKQVQGAFATAEIYPPLQLADITTEDLLYIKETDAQGCDETWHAFVQTQSHIRFDRFTQFPFCLHVWVDTANDQARVFLFSDHYVSDGSSGNTILNDILSFAAALSCDETSNQMSDELPVRPSLYNIILDNRPFVSPMIRFLVKYGLRTLLKATPKFVPVITPRGDQQDFRMPNAPDNASTMLFANGNKDNLAKLLAKCREEATTFYGALNAAIVVGYMVTTHSVDSSEAFKMFLYANLNMRSRADAPVEPETVGSYASAALSDLLLKTGLQASTQKFWDLARALKQETVAMPKNFALLALFNVVMDQNYHSQVNPSLFEDFSVKYSNVGDVNVSSVGKYPHTTCHQMRTGDLHIESLHYNLHTPFLTTSCQFYVTSVHGVGYGCNHHYDEDVGKSLFDTVVMVMEHSWMIDTSDSLVDVIGKLVKQHGGNHEKAPMA